MSIRETPFEGGPLPSQDAPSEFLASHGKSTALSIQRLRNTNTLMMGRGVGRLGWSPVARDTE